MNLLSNLTIKNRTYLNIITTVVGIFIIITAIYIGFTKLTDLKDEKLTIAQLENSVLKLRLAEKDFLARKDIKYVQIFQQEFKQLSQLSSEFKAKLTEHNINTNSLDDFVVDINEYSNKFQLIVKNQQEIGLDHKSGYYGSLRNAVHQIESLIAAQNKHELMVFMLQLRRAEKDFMLRLNTQYVEKFNLLIQEFNQNLIRSDLTNNIRSDIKNSLNLYQTNFQAFVNAQKRQGLDNTSGLNGEMLAVVDKTDESLAQLLSQANKAIEKVYRESLFTGSLIIAVIILITILLGYLLAQSVITPINHLCKTINNIREHNDLSIRIAIKGDDEIAFLSQTFNELQTDFGDAIGYINQTTGELDKAMAQLSQMTSDTQQSMHDQQKQADMAATAATEMQSTVTEIAQNTESAANNAANTASLTAKGKEQVSNTVKVITHLAESLNSANSEVSLLEEDSKTIGTILEVIRAIAEQTNLLALNAAIESARAGEQGRGFAVVADEVRNLAMRTQESTKQIENTIAKLQARSTQIVDIIQDCLNDGKESVTQANQANEMLDKISQEISSISDTSAMIAASVEQQNVVTEEVNQNVVKIRDISQEIYQKSEMNTQISININSSLTELHQSVDKFKV